MATNDQLKTVGFVGGIDAKVAPEDLPPVKLASLINGVFDSDGSIQKRGAFELLQSAVAGGDSVRLAKRGEELLVQDSGGTLRRMQSDGPVTTVTVDPNLIPGFTVPSGFTRGSLSVKKVSDTSEAQQNADFAVFRDAADRVVVGAIWEAGGILRYQISLDETDNVILAGPFANVAGASTNAKGRVIAVGTKLFFYYVKTYISTGFTELILRAWDSATPSTMGAEVVLSLTGSAVCACFDVHVDGTTIALAYRSDLETILGCLDDADGSTFVSKAVVTGMAGSLYAHALAIESQSKIMMFTRGTPGVDLVVRGAVAASSGAVSASAVTVATVASGVFLNRITAVYKKPKVYLAFDVDTSNIFVPVTAFDSTHPNIDVRGATLNTSLGVLVSDQVLLRGAALATDFNADAFLGVVLGNDNTVIVGLDDLYEAIASLSKPFPPYQVARFPVGDSPTVGDYPPPLLTFEGQYWGGYFRYPVGLNSEAQFSRFVVDFTTKMNFAESQGLTYFAGGCPYVYDGKYIAEEGFSSLPVIDYTASGATGPLTEGTFALRATFEWPDGQGNRHESAPSLPVSVVLSGGGTFQLSALVRQLRQTWKAGAKLVLWRTEANGSLYYRDSEYANDVQASGELLVTVAKTDAELISQELLYTTGEQLQNDPMPPCKYLAIHQNRIVGVGLLDPYSLFVSFLPDEGYPPTYNASVNAGSAVPQLWGTLTAAAGLDDKLLLFGTNCSGYIFGEGPNLYGQGTTYSRPAVFAEGIGLPAGNQLSVQATPDGVWFGSNIGLRLVTRGLALAMSNENRMLGSEVDPLRPELDEQTYIGSMFLKSRQMVLFFSEDQVLVFDHTWKQWSKFTSAGLAGGSAGAAIALNDKVVFVNGSQLFRMSDTPGGTDYVASSIVQFRFRTAFIRFDQLAGFVRAKRVQVLYRNAEECNLQVYHDYVYVEAQVKQTIATTDSDNAKFFEHHILNQKCRAIAFEVSELTTAPASFSGLTLLLGMKYGIRKLNSANRTHDNGN